ncbi:MAG: hypothetical protein J2P17_08270 [Mycobacterium sp.]|nr:hypothetical protein [Mycobacterium sp.]
MTGYLATGEAASNEYSEGFMAGHRAGRASGRCAAAAQIEQYRRRIHELDQENNQLRRALGRTARPEINVTLGDLNPGEVAQIINTQARRARYV